MGTTTCSRRKTAATKRLPNERQARLCIRKISTAKSPSSCDRGIFVILLFTDSRHQATTSTLIFYHKYSINKAATQGFLRRLLSRLGSACRILCRSSERNVKDHHYQKASHYTKCSRVGMLSRSTSGISSSTTTYSIAPAAAESSQGMKGVSCAAAKTTSTPKIGSTTPDSAP